MRSQIEVEFTELIEILADNGYWVFAMVAESPTVFKGIKGPTRTMFVKIVESNSQEITTETDAI